jgi:hypothetical protein
MLVMRCIFPISAIIQFQFKLLEETKSRFLQWSSVFCQDHPELDKTFRKKLKQGQRSILVPQEKKHIKRMTMYSSFKESDKNHNIFTEERN